MSAVIQKPGVRLMFQKGCEGFGDLGPFAAAVSLLDQLIAKPMQAGQLQAEVDFEDFCRGDVEPMAVHLVLSYMAPGFASVVQVTPDGRRLGGDLWCDTPPAGTRAAVLVDLEMLRAACPPQASANAELP